MKKRTLLISTTTAALALALSGTGSAGADDGHGSDGSTLRTVAPLNAPRGIDALGHGKTLVTEGDGTFSLVLERRHAEAKVIKLGQLNTDFAPAIAAGRHHTIWLLTGGGAPPAGDAAAQRGFRAQAEPAVDEPAPPATLFKWRPGWDEPKPFVDIAAYQATDPDPFDLEDFPADSNPFGLAALRDGSVLVSDAAGNDLLRVFPNKHIKTVARLMPRVVAVPAGLPEVPPEEGGPLPPAGTEVPSEGVATSVTVGNDGYWYIGELRGFPATPGTSQIWRVKAGTTDATCNPEDPYRGSCKRFADGLTSIVDLGADHGAIYAVELSKQSWFAMELGLPGSEIGALIKVTRHNHHTHLTELVPDQLTMPSGVDVARGIYLTGPIFGPGSLMKISR